MVLTSQRKSVKLSSLKPPGRDSLMPLAICTGPIPFQLYIKSSVVQPSIIYNDNWRSYLLSINMMIKYYVDADYYADYYAD